MVTRGTASLVAAGVLLAACAGFQRPPSPPAAAPVTSAVAQATGGAPPAAQGASDLNRELLSQTSRHDEGDLPLGPGDLIEVAVFEVPEFQGLKLRIPNGGQVSLPLIGVLGATGLSAHALEGEIRTRLQARYVHDPQVAVFVHEHRSQRISVIGAVRAGGVFTLTNPLRLADALAMAGGLSDDAGGTVHVIRRPATEPAQGVPGNGSPANGSLAGPGEQVITTVDLPRLAAGTPELNLPLQAGDVIEVPKAGSFYVGGEVNRPGSFPLLARTTLDQAPVVAGGVKEAADWNDVRVYRTRPDGTREVLTFSLDAFEQGRPAPEIQQNDVVIIGKSGVKAFLYALRDIFKFGVGATANYPLFP
jgi:polysaccharide export outer membrane protein